MSESRTPEVSSVPPLSDRAYRIVFWIMGLLFDGWLSTRFLGQENLPPEGSPTIICFSHTSALDYVGGYAVHRKGYYAIKREVLELPIVGRILRGVGGIPIKRDERDSEALRTMRQVLLEGNVLGIAPEGTRSRDGALGSYDPGFVWLASRTGATIVPMAIHGAHPLLPPGRLIPKRGTIWVALGEPVSLAEEGRRLSRQRMEEIASDLRARTIDLLADLSAESGQEDPAVLAEHRREALPGPEPASADPRAS